MRPLKLPGKKREGNLRQHLRRLLMFVSLFVVAITNGWALNPIRGMIPLDYVSRPATDLMYQGELLTPEKAHDLYMKFKGEFSLSELDPAESDVWKNRRASAVDPALDELPVNYADTVEDRKSVV